MAFSCRRYLLREKPARWKQTFDQTLRALLACSPDSGAQHRSQCDVPPAAREPRAPLSPFAQGLPRLPARLVDARAEFQVLNLALLAFSLVAPRCLCVRYRPSCFLLGVCAPAVAFLNLPLTCLPALQINGTWATVASTLDASDPAAQHWATVVCRQVRLPCSEPRALSCLLAPSPWGVAAHSRAFVSCQDG
jgi:hypothetical protein